MKRWCHVVVMLIGVAGCEDKKAEGPSGFAAPKSAVVADGSIPPKAPIAVDAAPVPDAAVAAVDTKPELPAGRAPSSVGLALSGSEIDNHSVVCAFVFR
jgi:hypothetical protein